MKFGLKPQLGLPGGTVGNSLPANAGATASTLVQEDSTPGAIKAVCHDY